MCTERDVDYLDTVLWRGMSNGISLLKARYCLSVMGAASGSSDEQARHLIDCLTTESPTGGTSRAVAEAEADAYEAIHRLSQRMADRSMAAVSGEWDRAKQAVLRWIQAAS